MQTSQTVEKPSQPSAVEELQVKAEVQTDITQTIDKEMVLATANAEEGMLMPQDDNKKPQDEAIIKEGTNEAVKGDIKHEEEKAVEQAETQLEKEIIVEEDISNLSNPEHTNKEEEKLLIVDSSGPPQKVASEVICSKEKTPIDETHDKVLTPERSNSKQEQIPEVVSEETSSQTLLKETQAVSENDSKQNTETEETQVSKQDIIPLKTIPQQQNTETLTEKQKVKVACKSTTPQSAV